MQFLQLNARGLNNPQKKLEFKELLRSVDPDIVLISETHFSHKSNPDCDGYYIYRADRTTQRGGGVAIFVKKSIPHKVLNTEIHSELEYVSVLINNNITVCSCYVPKQNRNFVNIVDKLLNNSTENIILGGDFNAKHKAWDCHDNNINGVALYDYCSDNSDISMNFPDTSTRISPNNKHTNSTIDLIISRKVVINPNIQTINNFDSDHLPLIYKVEQNFDYIFENQTSQKRAKINWKCFRSYLNSEVNHLVNITTPAILDETVNFLTSSIIKAIDFSTEPSKSSKTIDSIPPEILKHIKFKNKLTRIYHKRNCPILKKEINYLNSYIAKLIRKNKNEMLEKNISKINEKENHNFHLYQKINKLIKKRNPIQPFITNNTLIQDDTEKAELIATHFANIHKQNEGMVSKKSIKNINKSNLYYFQNSETSKIPFISLKKLQIQIKNMKNNKSPGFDNISNEILKNLPNKSLILFTKIINSIFKLGHFPKSWKTSKVIAIPKPGKIPNEPKNLRPISLLNSMSKLAEKFIHHYCSDWASEKNILPNEQFGFRREHSTTQALSRVNEHIIKNFNKGMNTLAVSLDIEKAFDTVWHEGLLHKLIQCQFPKFLIVLIASYLKGRTFFVQLNSSYSSIKNVCAGVPQGSILGPLLYILYTHDIPKFKKNTHLTIYADDTLLYVSHYPKYFEAAKTTIAKYMEKINNYFKNWQILINNTKTKAILFRNKIFYNYNRNLNLLGTQIKIEDTLKYLGITLDSEMKFNEHIKIITGKAWGAVNLLSPLLRSPKLKRDIKVLIYLQYVRPLLSYALPSWSNTSRSLLSKLEVIERKCLRLCIAKKKIIKKSNFKYIRNVKLYRKCKIETFYNFSKRITSITKLKMYNSNNILINSLNKFSKEYFSLCKRQPNFNNYD